MAESRDLDTLKQGLHEYFKSFPFFRLLGMELVDIEPGRAKIRITHRDDLVQPAGILHGGVTASLIDTTIAHAILLTEPYLAAQEEGARIVSVDLRIKYLRPVSQGSVVCTATLPRLGRQIIHADAVVVDEREREIARGDSIYMIVHGGRLQRTQ